MVSVQKTSNAQVQHQQSSNHYTQSTTQEDLKKTASLLRDIIKSLGMHKPRTYGINVNAMKRHPNSIWSAKGLGGKEMLFDPSAKKLFFKHQSPEPETGLIHGEMIVYQLDEEDQPHLSEIQQGRFKENAWISGNYTHYKEGVPSYMHLVSFETANGRALCDEERHFMGQYHCPEQHTLMRQVLTETNGVKKTFPDVCSPLAVHSPSQCMQNLQSRQKLRSMTKNLVESATTLGIGVGLFYLIRWAMRSRRPNRPDPGLSARRALVNQRELLQRRDNHQASNPVERRQSTQTTSNQQDISNDASSSSSETDNSNNHLTPGAWRTQPRRRRPQTGYSFKPNSVNRQKRKTRGQAQPIDGHPRQHLIARHQTGAPGAEEQTDHSTASESPALSLNFSRNNAFEGYVIELPHTHIISRGDGRTISVDRYVFEEHRDTTDQSFQDSACRVLSNVTSIYGRNSRGAGIKFSGSKDPAMAYKLKFRDRELSEFRCLGRYEEDTNSFHFGPPIRHSEVDRLVK